MFRKRILLLTRMDEIPLVELVFWARKSSHIYLVVLLCSIALLIMNRDVNSVLMALSITELVLMVINLIALRVVIANPSKCNTLACIVVVILLEIFYSAITIVGAVEDLLNPLYKLIIPLVWIVLELTTIVIMFKFHRKVCEEESATGVERRASAKNLSLLDNEIVYSHNASDSGSSGEALTRESFGTEKSPV